MKETVIINVPVSWSDVTVAQFQALSNLKKEDYKSDVHYTADVISILCNVNTIQLDAETFAAIAEELKFLGTEIKGDKKEELTIDDKLYRWKGNLNQVTVGEMISIEQVLDLEELSYQMSYDLIAAVLLREVKKDDTVTTFNADKFEANRALFGELPVTDVIGMINFFIAGGRVCMPLSVDYSVRPMSTRTSTQKKSWLSKKLSSLKMLLTRGSNG